MATSDQQSLAALADQTTESFSNIGKLMFAVSYLFGLLFVVVGIGLLVYVIVKAHQKKMRLIHIIWPIAMIITGHILIFLPAIFSPA